MPADDKSIRDLRLQLQLIEHGMTMADLLDQLESGNELSEEIMKILEESFDNDTRKEKAIIRYN